MADDDTATAAPKKKRVKKAKKAAVKSAPKKRAKKVRKNKGINHIANVREYEKALVSLTALTKKVARLRKAL